VSGGGLDEPLGGQGLCDPDLLALELCPTAAQVFVTISGGRVKEGSDVEAIENGGGIVQAGDQIL
jgi:hypothetical protein